MPRVQFEDTLPYKASDLYDLVMDIERYPEIFDDIRAVKVRKTGDHDRDVDVHINAPFIRDAFYRCTVNGTPPQGIDIKATAGMFKSMQARWRFNEAASGQETRIRYDMDFDFGGLGFKNAIAAGFIQDEILKTRDRLKVYAAKVLTPPVQP